MHDELNFQIAQFYGAFDDDFNGELELNEMPRWLRRSFEAGRLRQFNANRDNVLSHSEYRAFAEYRAQRAK